MNQGREVQQFKVELLLAAIANRLTTNAAALIQLEPPAHLRKRSNRSDIANAREAFGQLASKQRRNRP